MKKISYVLPLCLIVLSHTVAAQTITTGTITGSPFCAGSSVNVPYTITGSFNSGNVFRAQLSDGSGNFGATPTVIGSLTSRNAGTIAAVIPSTTPAGSNYRIRVVSTNPIRTGSTSTSVLTIKTLGTCNVAGALLDDLDDVTIASPANGQVLSYNGTAWVNTAPAGGGAGSWLLAGNSGIDPATHFIGTINDAPLLFKIKNQKSGIIDSALKNTSFGFLSLLANSSGYKNTAFGAGALSMNTIGYSNVAIGHASMYNNNAGYENIAIGDSAGGFMKYDYFPDNPNPPAPYGNIAIGSKAMKEASYSRRNTAIGYKSMYLTTNRSVDNVAIGSESLMSNRKGSYNVAVGSRSLYNNTQISYIPAYGAEDPGEMNIAIGYESLFNNLIGDNNTAVGNRSLYSNTSLYNPDASNIGLVYNSGNENTAFGNSSLYHNSIGDSNTAVGSYAMMSNVKGIGNTTIGSYSDIGTDSMYGATAIGFRSKVNCDNCLVLGAVAQENYSKENTRIGIGTTFPDSSAALEINSTQRGLLIPRMTQEQRVAITNPSEGLMVYQTDNTKGFWYYDGVSWANNLSNNSGWSLTGNSGLNATTNFIGTTSAVPLIFKVNNTLSGLLDLGANTSLGFNSFNNTSTACCNTAIGSSTLKKIKGNGWNTAIGWRALENDSTGIESVALGWQSLLKNQQSANTGLGSRTLENNINGGGNLAAGFSALHNNINGNDNTGLGAQSLFSNTSGFLNTAIGNNSLYTNTTGSKNTATGYQALFSNTTGNYNTANGVTSMLNNTTGEGNTSLGYQSLLLNNGNFNTAIGSNSLLSNSSGYENTASGINALQKNTTGYKNTASGSAALYTNTTGNENTSAGFNSLFLNSTGNGNSAFGKNALGANTTGNNNTAIGFEADLVIGDLNNSTAIGFGAIVNASNKVRIGNTSVTVIEGQVAMTTSDGRFKSNIKEDAPGLNLIMKLKPVTYNFQYSRFSAFLKEKAADKQHLKEKDAKKEMGLVAQDVEKACKELGIEVSNLIHVPENQHDNYALAYGQLVVPLVKAVQELKKIIDEQDKKITSLENKLTGTQPVQPNARLEVTVLENNAITPLLGQNIPNPFNSQTIIPFRIPNHCKDAAIVISNISTGQVIKAIPISCLETQLSIDAGKLSAGSYSYSLYIEGKPVETKKMIIQH